MNNKIKFYLFAIFMLLAYNVYSQTEYSYMNTTSDERTIAFSVLNGDEIQIWRTTGKGCANPHSRMLEYSTGTNISFATATSLNRSQAKNNGLFYDGSPAFPVCYWGNNHFDWGVIVSNKFVNNKDFDNDIYEIKYNNSSKIWEIARRIDEVNSPYWDDTPAISYDGKVMIFSSNRSNPKSLQTDLYITKLSENGKWSVPVNIAGLSEANVSEVSPFFGPDGYLYFANNKSGDYDIYRIKLSADCTTVGTVESLSESTFSGVNQKGTNEVSPCFSPAGQFFLFSSDRKDNSTNFNFYYMKANKILKFDDDVNFAVQCWQLSDKMDFFKDIEKREKTSCASTINYVYNGDSKTLNTDANGNANFKLPRYNGNTPHQDTYTRNAKINVDIPKVQDACCDAKRDFILIFNPFCADNQNADLELFCSQLPLSKFPFIIDSIPFFVTSYWCPSTLKFKDNNTCGCTSIFNINTKCEIDPPEQQVTFDYGCKSNEVYSFTNKYNPVVKPIYSVYRTAGSCIDISEMNNIKNKVKGFDWSERVDLQIESLYKQMERALDNIYIKFALEKGEKLKIKIYGWTDLRPLSNDCKYTGEDIDLSSGIITLEEKALLYGKMITKNYIDENVIKKGSLFVNQWRSGNQLLSDLRAYYMAYLLNNLWMKIDKYKELTLNNQIELKAIGKGIKSKPGVPMHYNRSVDVLVEIEQGDKIIGENVTGSNPEETINFKVTNYNCNK